MFEANGVTVIVLTRDVTASAGVDYVATSQRVIFRGTETQKTVSIPIVNDGVFEEDETLNVTLTNVEGTGGTDPGSGTPRFCIVSAAGCVSPTSDPVTSGSLTTAVTITSDDPPLPTPPPATFTLSVAPSPVAEGRAVTATVTLNLGAGFVLRDANGAAATVLTIDGTASAGVYYVTTSQTVTFTGTDPTQTVTIPILNDRLAEEGETFNVALTNAGGGPPQVCPQTDPTCTEPTADPVSSGSGLNTTVITITGSDQPPPPPPPEDACFGVRCLGTIAGLTPNQISTATAIDTFCVEAAGDLGARCRPCTRSPMPRHETRSPSSPPIPSPPKVPCWLRR